MKTTILVLFTIFSAYAEEVKTKDKPQPVPPKVVTAVSEVSYWKLAKLASDDETLKVRQALIQADRIAILTEICHAAGISNLAECQISPDVKTVTKIEKK